MDAGMRTQVLNWMNKGTTESLSAVCMNRGQRESVRSCRGSEIQQAVMKASIRFPGQKSRLFKGSICRVLGAQGRCSAGSSVTRTEAPGSGSGGGPRRRRQRTVPSLTRLTLSWVWLWCRVGHVLTLSQPLGYSSEVKTAYR